MTITCRHTPQGYIKDMENQLEWRHDENTEFGTHRCIFVAKRGTPLSTFQTELKCLPRERQNTCYRVAQYFIMHWWKLADFGKTLCFPTWPAGAETVLGLMWPFPTRPLISFLGCWTSHSLSDNNIPVNCTWTLCCQPTSSHSTLGLQNRHRERGGGGGALFIEE